MSATSRPKGASAVKLVVIVCDDEDARRLNRALSEEGLKSTVLASTGGFLLKGNTTLLVGTERSRTEDVKRIVREHCKRRKKFLSQPSADLPGMVHAPVEVETGGAVIFTLDVEDFIRF